MVVNNNANPSQNPSNNDTLNGAFKQALKKFLQRDIDDMLPAQVISVSDDRKYVSVQPMVMVVSTLNESLERAPVAKVPLFQIGGGGFVLSFPVKAGDLGWIKANDRDISLFVQTLQNSPPNTWRMHDFADGIFIPHVMAGFIVGDDADNAVLSSLDGSVKISLSSDTITLTAPNIIMNSNLTIDGDLNITGSTIGNGINLNTHIHSGVQTGSGDTGEPVV